MTEPTTTPSLTRAAQAAAAAAHAEAAKTADAAGQADRAAYGKLLADARIEASILAAVIFGDYAGTLRSPAAWEDEMPTWGARGDSSVETARITLYAPYRDPLGGTYLFVYRTGEGGDTMRVATGADGQTLTEWLDEERPDPFDTAPFTDAAELGILLRRTGAAAVLTGPPVRPLHSRRIAELIEARLGDLEADDEIRKAGGDVSVQRHRSEMLLTVHYPGTDGTYWQHWLVREIDPTELDERDTTD